MSPSFVFLPLVKSSLRPDFHVSAQNCWVKKGGAYTGEVRYGIVSFIFGRYTLLLSLSCSQLHTLFSSLS